MKKIFTKKRAVISIVAVFTLSLFAWGVVLGDVVGSDKTTTSIEVESLFSIAVAPAAVAFNQAGGVGGGAYGVIDGNSTDVFAEEVVTVTITSPIDYSINVTSSDMVNTNDPGFPDVPGWTVIPAAEIQYSLTGSGDPFVSLDAGVNVVENALDGVDVEHEIDLKVKEVPETIFEGSHVGELTFDLTVL